jgi:16S rRNA (guanine966-N2)-methyltransferase
VTLIEASPPAAQALREAVRKLDAQDRVDVIQTEALAWLDSAASQADIIFLDPPFQQGLLGPALDRIARRQLVTAGGRIYVEVSRKESLPPPPPGWLTVREKTAGQVRFGLMMAPETSCFETAGT